MKTQTSYKLACDMSRACADTVSHIDSDGYVYCATHGANRQQHARCRKLTASELKKLRAGQTISRY
jgi:hypothetical protein